MAQIPPLPPSVKSKFSFLDYEVAQAVPLRSVAGHAPRVVKRSWCGYRQVGTEAESVRLLGRNHPCGQRTLACL